MIDLGDFEAMESFLESFLPLLMSPGVPGREGDVTKWLYERVKPHSDEIHVDTLGNLIAVKEGRRSDGHLMLLAHTDELGLVVSNILDEGLLKFKKLGGIDDRVLASRHVIVHGMKGPCEGVIGWTPPHLVIEPDEMKKVVGWQDLFIDVGAESADEAFEMGISIGDPITFKKQLSVLNNKLVASRAMDDRIGCWILMKFMERVGSVKAKISAVFSSQEEIGFRGASTAAFAQDPSFAVAVDTGSASGFPMAPQALGSFRVGRGPVLRIVDSRMVVSVKAKDFIVKVAEKGKIPYQLGVTGGSTDVAAVQLARKGVMVCPICVPLKYSHSFGEVASFADIENTLSLLLQVAEEYRI